MNTSSTKRIAKIISTCLVLSFFILACESQDKSQVKKTQENPQPVPEAASNSSFTSKQICLAGIATVMAWAESPTGGQSEFGDYDSDEGNNHIFKSSKGLYKCYVEGNKIIWGTKDGRWRNSPADGGLTYVASGDILTVTETFSDGSKNAKDYSKDLLSSHSK
jgi:hypothetical protein